MLVFPPHQIWAWAVAMLRIRLAIAQRKETQSAIIVEVENALKIQSPNPATVAVKKVTSPGNAQMMPVPELEAGGEVPADTVAGAEVDKNATNAAKSVT
ncbi:MAG: hypothetical protein Q9227_008622 [Pyrenula ochraceoflavens]